MPEAHNTASLICHRWSYPMGTFCIAQMISIFSRRAVMCAVKQRIKPGMGTGTVKEAKLLAAH
jgi:hypothetical protein